MAPGVPSPLSCQQMQDMSDADVLLATAPRMPPARTPVGYDPYWSAAMRVLLADGVSAPLRLCIHSMVAKMRSAARAVAIRTGGHRCASLQGRTASYGVFGKADD